MATIHPPPPPPPPTPTNLHPKHTSDRSQKHLEAKLTTIRKQGLRAGNMALRAGDVALKLQTMALHDRRLLAKIQLEGLHRDNPAVEYRLWELETACEEMEARSREWAAMRVAWLVKRSECVDAEKGGGG